MPGGKHMKCKLILALCEDVCVQNVLGSSGEEVTHYQRRFEPIREDNI